ncbi:MAG: peptidoglycan-binding domain-containing protein [Pseudomonadota bacterium]
MFTKMLRTSGWISIAIAGLLAACAAVEPPIATHIRQPDEPAERNFTSFSDSLRCMDDLLVSHRIQKTLVTSNGFPDLTSSVRIAADDMLVRAIGLMNARSHAFVFIDQALEKDLGQNVYITERPQHEPEVYIRGAISQYDKKSVDESFNLPLGIDLASDAVGGAGLNGSRIVGVITVDMHLVTFPDKLIMPGSSVSNSMVLVEDGLGGGLTGIFGVVNYNLTWKTSRIESPGQAVRNLIELGTIELLGRYAGVPYWQCLAIDRTQPSFSTTEQAAWWAIPDLARVGMVQRKLHKLGYLGDYRLGVHDMATRRAISRFQADNRLIATGVIDFDLHARLKEMVGGYNETSIDPPSTPPPGSVERARFGGERGHPGKVRISVSPVLPDDNQPLQLGDQLVLAIRTDREAYVNCYYQAPKGGIYRV